MTTLHEEPLHQRVLVEENEDSYSDPECNEYDVYDVSAQRQRTPRRPITTTTLPFQEKPAKLAPKGRLSASKTMDSLMDYSNAGPIFSTQITNNVNGPFLHNQSAGVSSAGTTNIQSTGTNSLLRNVIGTPSMSSSTSSGYGSQAVSLGNLTNDDTLSLRSMSVDETPDLDRSSSASPPGKSGARVDQITTPFTPSGSQKRFNPFLKDSVMESSASSTSTLVKTPLTPTKKHPLANSDEEHEEQQDLGKAPNEAVLVNAVAQKVESVAESATIENEPPLKVENNNCTEMANRNEAPLPDWVVLGESVLIRPTNSSGVISFIGPTHFQVRLG